MKKTQTERKAFIFYRSFYEAGKQLETEDKAIFYEAILAYIFEDESVDLPPSIRSLFVLIKPQLDANKKRYDNGCKGGAPKKELTASEKKEELRQDEVTPIPEEIIDSFYASFKKNFGLERPTDRKLKTEVYNFLLKFYEFLKNNGRDPSDVEKTKTNIDNYMIWATEQDWAEKMTTVNCLTRNLVVFQRQVEEGEENDGKKE